MNLIRPSMGKMGVNGEIGHIFGGLSIGNGGVDANEFLHQNCSSVNVLLIT